MTKIFLWGPSIGGDGVQYFPDPGNWNPVNTIICVGAGGHGVVYDSAGGSAGGGGGGGAYAIGHDIVPAEWPVPYWAYDPRSSTAGQTFTTFNKVDNLTNGSVPGEVTAQNATGPAIGGAAGLAGLLFYPEGFPGGAGGSAAAGTGGGGGGGAAGPSGPGGNGANGIAATAGIGGSSDGGTAAGGVIGNPNGIKGRQFSATVGCGSGACGSNPSSYGMAGMAGQYGSGGGGGSSAMAPGGMGQGSIVFIEYEPIEPEPEHQARAIIMS
jgi:hypothetical protein